MTMTCKNCLHYCVCDYVSILGKVCKDFKNSSEWVKVRHGRWIQVTPFSCDCSLCGCGRYGLATDGEDYCKKCGARMDGEPGNTGELNEE